VVEIPEVQALRGRRSYAEVLLKNLPPLEENLGECSGPVARVLPIWVRDLSKGDSTDKTVRVPVSRRSISGKRKFGSSEVVQ
jgi:hypothetical protein